MHFEGARACDSHNILGLQVPQPFDMEFTSESSLRGGHSFARDVNSFHLTFFSYGCLLMKSDQVSSRLCQFDNLKINALVSVVIFLDYFPTREKLSSLLFPGGDPKAELLARMG